MRLLIIFSVVATVLLIVGQCDANEVRWPDRGLNDQLYGRVMDACQEKVEEWRNSYTVVESPTSLDDKRDSWSFIAGAFMRGKWKPFVSGPQTDLPSFISGNGGTFDFYSPDFGVLMDGVTLVSSIVNITGQLYFWNGKEAHSKIAFLNIGGVYDNNSREICMVACLNEMPTFAAQGPATQGTQNRMADVDNRGMPTNAYTDEKCDVRGLLTISHKKKQRWKSVHGNLESLRNLSAPGYFSKIGLDGRILNSGDQRSLYRLDLFVKAIIFAFEAIIIAWQICHSIMSPSSYFVSMLMILVQIMVMCYFLISLLYIPLRLLTLKKFKYLLSNLALLPWVILTCLILLNIVFILVILRKRRVARRLNVVERPREALLAMIFVIIYAITGVVLWTTHNLESYLQVVWCWVFLPQVIANVVWDTRFQPLHLVYIVGVSLCRITYIGFNAARPTVCGFDDLEDFPHGWFWGITGTVLFFGAYALLQQYYGGRCFLPHRFFGYKQISTSKGETFQELSFEKDDDTMLDL